MAAPLSRAEFDVIFEQCRQWGWGTDDERGALNHLGPAEVVAAAALVRSGRTVSCAWDLDTREGPDNPDPVTHEMAFGFDTTFGDSGALRIAGDRFAMTIHGDAHSHVDALCHVGFNGFVYNGLTLDQAIGPDGARAQSVTVIKHGIVTRGVLVDVPRYRGTDWVEPGEAIGPDEFLAAEAASGTRPGPGLVDPGQSQPGRPGPRLRRGAPLGVPAHVRPTAAGERHRLPGQPHRRLLTRPR
jgi:hypothetical protein